MKRKRPMRALAWIMALALAGLGGVRAADPAAITFSRQVAPILQKKCQSCHRPGEVAPFSLLSYAEARPWAESIKEEVEARRMPPWHAGPESTLRFQNDPSLTPEELKTLVAWVEGGAPEGDAKDLPPPRKWPTGWTIGEPDQVFTMREEYPVPASGAVKYQYFSIPTGFTEDRWIRAMEVRPGNRAVVHHILVFALAPDAKGKQSIRGDLIRQPRAWDNYLGGMVPGGTPVELPEGTARRIPAGSTLILQVHYTPNGKPATDRSQVGFKFGSASVKTEVVTRLAANRDFKILPGAPAQQVGGEYTFSRDAQLQTLMPHMHLRGKSFEYRAIFPDGTERLLLSVPRYDFNWQHTYRLAEPLAMPKGTKVRCVATYDNSTANKHNPDPTKLVTWGDQTWEEMMIGFVSFSRAPAPPKAPAARAGEAASTRSERF